MSTLLERYKAGDCEAVWEELTALGPGVRHKLYYDDAVDVAAETMRRARHNVELLISRLAEQGYRFIPPEDEDTELMMGVAGAVVPFSSVLETGGERMQGLRAKITERKAAKAAKVTEALKIPPMQNPEVFSPPGSDVPQLMKRLEKMARGPVPISLAAWYEQVGGVSLNGSHPVINPLQSAEGICGDPLMVTPLPELVECAARFGNEEEGEINLWIAPDDLHKANTSGGDPYTITIPDASADPPLQYEGHETTFVKYLRIAFQWGGFPGWERSKNPPREAIAKLNEGLLPL